MVEILFLGGWEELEAGPREEDLWAGGVGVQGALAAITLRSLILERRAGEVPGRATSWWANPWEEFHAGTSLLAGVCSPGTVPFPVGVLCSPPIIGLVT